MTRKHGIAADLRVCQLLQRDLDWQRRATLGRLHQNIDLLRTLRQLSYGEERVVLRLMMEGYVRLRRRCYSVKVEAD